MLVTNETPPPEGLRAKLRLIRNDVGLLLAPRLPFTIPDEAFSKPDSGAKPAR